MNGSLLTFSLSTTKALPLSTRYAAPPRRRCRATPTHTLDANPRPMPPRTQAVLSFQDVVASWLFVVACCLVFVLVQLLGLRTAFFAALLWQVG